MLSARREEIAWVHSEGVYDIVPMQECKDAGKKKLELIWVNTNKPVDSAHLQIRSRLCQGIQDEEARQDLSCSRHCHHLKLIMMSVSWTSKGKLSKLRHCDIGRAHFQGTDSESCTSVCQRKIDRDTVKTKLAD